MNTLKSKKQINTTKRWNWMTMFFIGILAIGIASCEKKEETTSDGQEIETAWVISYYDQLPTGRIWYMDVHETLPAKVDKSTGVEIGLNAQVYDYDGHPFTINPDAKTITKWNVDSSTLEISVDGILSFASTGLSNNGKLAFVSSTAAFLHDVNEGIIVEFNPTTMEITTTHKITPLNPSAIVASANSWNTKVKNGKLLLPIAWYPSVCCEYPKPLYATVAVFDPSTGLIDYKEDTRSVGLDSYGLVSDENGILYGTPGRVNSMLKKYYNLDTNSFPGVNTLLKFNENGTWDSDFKIDLTEVIPSLNIFTGASFIYQNKMAFIYSDSELDESFDNRWNFYNHPSTFHSVILDLNTLEVQSFTQFDDYTSVILLNHLDNVNYFRSNGEGNSDGVGVSRILKQNSIDDYGIFSEIEGGSFTHLGKLW